jgi:tRNA modification GTPase
MLVGRVPEPRRAVLAKIRDCTGDPIDVGLVLWFPAPRSETGEDMAELHLHGGRAVIADTLAALGRIEGFRPAEPGEFTRRAFANGRLDLTAVEGLADLILAETAAQRRQAFRQLSGRLGGQAESWRHRLVGALAQVEAGIDFSDEADVPADVVGPVVTTAAALRDEIAAALADERRGERLRDGFRVAIAGPPNAGKSSLLNWIARRDAAIVTPIPGTTRDVIEVHLDLDGYPVTLVDTAGIRETEDPVEQEGVRRAEAQATSADLLLWVVDVTEGDVRAIPTGEYPGQRRWLIRNKIDLLAPLALQGLTSATGREEFAISVRRGAGLDALIQALSALVSQDLGPTDSALITRERHRKALHDTIEALDRGCSSAGQEDILAEELRLAARALGRLTGRVDVEEILDVVFREFCIGK